MSSSGIVKFQPHGPDETGLVEWDPIDPDEIVSGTPVQRGHIYHEDPEVGYLTGVWDCTANTLKFGPYPVHEFMLLLEGSVTMQLEDGTQITVNAGEFFVIPKGLPCQWIQPGYVRKFFMIFEDPQEAPAADVSSQGIILPQAQGPSQGLGVMDLPDPSVYVGALPQLSNHTYFDDPSGQMHVGIWETTPSERRSVVFPRNELMCLLEGSVTLTDKDGVAQSINAGETVYVAKGTEMKWKTKIGCERFTQFTTLARPQPIGSGGFYVTARFTANVASRRPIHSVSSGTGRSVTEESRCGDHRRRIGRPGCGQNVARYGQNGRGA